MDRAQKETVQMDERIKFLRAEKSDQFQMADDIQMELGKVQLIACVCISRVLSSQF